MKKLLTAGSIFILAACGSGGNGGGNPPVQMPPTTNSAPQITSAGTATVTENNQTVFTVGATDPDGNNLTFSISGGADANQFQISNSGALRFTSEPNFELPTDANLDNVYDVTVSVSDGMATITQNITITVENDKEGISVRKLAEGFNDITAIAPSLDATKIFVLERGGNIYDMDSVDGTHTLDRTIRNVNTDGEGGLLGLAVDPTFLNSEAYWVFVVAERSGFNATLGSNIQIRRVRRNSVELPLGTGTRLEIPHSTNVNYGGWLGFDRDQNLFILVGDAGDSGNAQNPNSKLGKILRLRLNPDPFAGASPSYFLTPPDNPFANGGGDRFVYGLGLQDPGGGFFYLDDLLFGDRGGSIAEEVNSIERNAGSANFGWPFFEGSTVSMGSTSEELTAPLTEYLRGNGDREGASIVGGGIYNGPIASLGSKYIFADRTSGKIWAIGLNDLVADGVFPSSRYELLNTDFEPDTGTLDTIVAIGTSRNGDLILADEDGEVFVVESSGF